MDIAKRFTQLEMGTAAHELAQKAYTATHTGAVYHQTRKDAPVRKVTKIGRNDPCPCGSGKKFKRCHIMVTRP